MLLINGWEADKLNVGEQKEKISTKKLLERSHMMKSCIRTGAETTTRYLGTASTRYSVK